MQTDFVMGVTYFKIQGCQNGTKPKILNFDFESYFCNEFFSLDSIWNFLLAFLKLIWPSSYGFQDKKGQRQPKWTNTHYILYEEFEDTKGVIRIRKSKKNRQHNGQKKKNKRTNNNPQNIHIKPEVE